MFNENSRFCVSKDVLIQFCQLLIGYLGIKVSNCILIKHHANNYYASFKWLRWLTSKTTRNKAKENPLLTFDFKLSHFKQWLSLQYLLIFKWYMSSMLAILQVHTKLDVFVIVWSFSASFSHVQPFVDVFQLFLSHCYYRQLYQRYSFRVDQAWLKSWFWSLAIWWPGLEAILGN